MVRSQGHTQSYGCSTYCI